MMKEVYRPILRVLSVKSVSNLGLASERIKIFGRKQMKPSANGRIEQSQKWKKAIKLPHHSTKR